MKKKLVAGLAAGMMLTGLAGGAQATLLTIGTAGYDSDGNGAVESTENYNLIWDDDNNGNSVVWLDYSNAATNLSAQRNWAASLGLGNSLTYNLNDGYTVDWGSNTWRLPDTVDAPHGGYNITNSELGHLFYTELGNQGTYNTAGELNATAGLTGVGDFDNLTAALYWSRTFTSYNIFGAETWYFNMDNGFQDTLSTGWEAGHGLAVRTGQVTYSDPNTGESVPEPATILLFGTALVGLVGSKKRRKRHV